MNAHERTIRDYLAALVAGVPASELARFFTSDAVQTELPNSLNPRGQRSDLPDVLARHEKGKGVLERQTFDLVNVIVSGDRVAVEADWSGTLANGKGMRAHFAMFFTFREGRIATQRNYDCFEPF